MLTEIFRYYELSNERYHWFWISCISRIMCCHISTRRHFVFCVFVSRMLNTHSPTCTCIIFYRNAYLSYSETIVNLNLTNQFSYTFILVMETEHFRKFIQKFDCQFSLAIASIPFLPFRLSLVVYRFKTQIQTQTNHTHNYCVQSNSGKCFTINFNFGLIW